MPDLATINSYFETVKNQYAPTILSRYWTTNPYAGLVESRPYEPEMGLVQTQVTATHELPTSYDLGANLTLSNGTGNAACSPELSIIGGGYTNRDFQLVVKAFETAPFCLTDMQFKFQAVQQAKALEKGLADYVTQWQADWNRYHNIDMIDNKVSTLTGNALDRATNSDADFSSVAVPTQVLSWSQLALLYDELTVIAAEQNAVAYSDGEPVFSLNIGPGLKRQLFLTNTLNRTTVDFLDMGKEYSRNFLARGIKSAYGGFLPNVDQNAIRYTSDGVTKIYPWINVATTAGYKAIRNPDYLTVANGGLAVYEAFSIMARGIYARLPRPIGATAFSLQQYNPISYVGDITWINNPDMGYNKQGNYGFYRIDIQQAAQPLFPELGFTGITLAVDGAGTA